MTERPDGHFLPASVGSAIERLATASDVPSGPVEGSRFRSFATLVGALHHFRSHSESQALIDAWNDAEPDDDTIAASIDGLLTDSNFTPVGKAELDAALETESLIPLRLDIDLDDYAHLRIARRASRAETVTLSKLKGLRTVDKTITVDGDVVIHSVIRDAEYFAARDIDPAERNLVPGKRSLKRFQDVPRADIEMLLPSVKVRFRMVDRLVVGVPAVASGIAVLATKLAPTIGLLVLLVAATIGLRDETPELDQAALAVLLGGAVTLGGFLFRQYAKFKNLRVEHLKTLTENLYFRTVGDGDGVIHSLFAAAEEQETLEVLLAYRFLVGPDARPLTRAELDEAVEAWFATDGPAIDFDVEDALEKMVDLDLVTIEGRRRATQRLRACPLPEALVRLDARWDALFDFPAVEGERETAGAGSDADDDGSPILRTTVRRLIERGRARIRLA